MGESEGPKLDPVAVFIGEARADIRNLTEDFKALGTRMDGKVSNIREDLQKLFQDYGALSSRVAVLESSNPNGRRTQLKTVGIGASGAGGFLFIIELLKWLGSLM